MTSMKTITILGTDYDGCEVIRQGDDWGIKTADQIFWLLPLFDGEGNLPAKIPPYPPRAIQPVTHVVPDLTADHPETVAQLFEKDRVYFAATTWEANCAEFPGDVEAGQEAFEKAKQAVLTGTLEQYARTKGARLHVWAEHGSDRLAAELGYLGHGILARGHDTLVSALRRRQRMDDEQAEELVRKVKHVVLYGSDAGGKRVYLEGMVKMPVAGAPTSEKAPATKEDVADALDRVAARLSKRESAQVENRKEAAELQGTASEAAVRKVIAEMRPLPVEREIIDMYWEENLSQDRILVRLREKECGKSKKFVGEVIARFNSLLESEGMRGKYRVTGKPIPPKPGRENGAFVPVAEGCEPSEMDDEALSAHKLRWDTYTPEEKRQVYNFSDETRRYFDRLGLKPGKPL